MTLQNFGQPLVLVAASACKCGGCMTLQKSAFRWLHEAANWHMRFNGAAPDRGRRVSYQLLGRVSGAKLQRGRPRSGAESTLLTRNEGFRPRASTGPPPIGGGEVGA